MAGRLDVALTGPPRAVEACRGPTDVGCGGRRWEQQRHGEETGRTHRLVFTVSSTIAGASTGECAPKASRNVPPPLMSRVRRATGTGNARVGSAAPDTSRIEVIRRLTTNAGHAALRSRSSTRAPTPR